MTDYKPDRLDRIEALVEKKCQIVESNARAIEIIYLAEKMSLHKL